MERCNNRSIYHGGGVLSVGEPFLGGYIPSAYSQLPRGSPMTRYHVAVTLTVKTSVVVSADDESDAGVDGVGLVELRATLALERALGDWDITDSGFEFVEVAT